MKKKILLLLLIPILLTACGKDNNKYLKEDTTTTSKIVTTDKNEEETTTKKIDDYKDNTTSVNKNENKTTSTKAVDNKTTTKKTNNTSESKKNTTTTKKVVNTTKGTTKATTSKYLVKMESYNVDVRTENYYNVPVKVYREDTKYYYSDNSTSVTNGPEMRKYDFSKFKATTDELKPEAIKVKNANQSIYKEVLGYVNGYRSEVSAEPLVLDDALSLAATIRAIEMAWSNKFDHTRPNGSRCFTVCSETSISCSGENIASGYTSAKSVSTGWYNSAGHKANMQNKAFKSIGIGYYRLNGNTYWVQLFR